MPDLSMIGRVIGLAAFAGALGLVVRALIELVRVRGHPVFTGMGGSLRLHLMVLGASAAGLDPPTRAHIKAIRRLYLAAVLLFAAGVAAFLLLGVGAAPA